MTWTEIGEFIKATAPAITAGAAVVGAFVGWSGLEKWQAESLGKRQAEIAEATLAVVYEMEEILRQARSALVLPHEMTKKEGVPDNIATDPNFAPEARLLEHQEFFGRFRAQRFAFAALFGRDAGKLLDDLWRCRLEINWAVDFLLRNKDMQNADHDYASLYRKHKNTAFLYSSADDNFGQRISECIEKIEDSCRPAIEARARLK
jgi:hypothetical protein